MVWKGFKDVNATIHVNVTYSEEEIFQRLHRSRKKNIKKAQKAKLLFIGAETEEEWKEWYSIYKKVWTAGGIEYKKLSYFQKPNSHLYLIRLKNKIVGGGVFEEFSNKIIFEAYASLIDFQRYRVNDFLYWNSFMYAKQNKKSFVDLGGWQINARGHLEGVNSFKEKWGGKIIYYPIYNKNPFYILGRKAIRNFVSIRWIWDRIKKRPLQKKSGEGF